MHGMVTTQSPFVRRIEISSAFCVNMDVIDTVLPHRATLPVETTIIKGMTKLLQMWHVLSNVSMMQHFGMRTLKNIGGEC